MGRWHFVADLTWAKARPLLAMLVPRGSWSLVLGLIQPQSPRVTHNKLIKRLPKFALIFKLLFLKKWVRKNSNDCSILLTWFFLP